MRPLQGTSKSISILLAVIVAVTAIAFILLPEPTPPVPTVAVETVTMDVHPTSSIPQQESESALLEETKIAEYVDSGTEPDAPDFDSMRAVQQQQLQYLKEINPDNLMIPTEKTDQEVEQMLAEMELHRTLQQRIDDNSATDEERQQYVALHRQKLQDELELIRLCEDVAANSLEAEEIQQAQLCTRIMEARDQRLQVIEASLLELDELLTAQVN